MSASHDRVPAWRRAAPRLLAGYVVVTVALVGAGVLLVHVLLHGRIGRWDEQANRWTAAHRTHALDDLTQRATLLANTEGIVLVAAVVVVVCLVRRRAADAAVPVVALVLELAVFLSTTFVVGRPRPDVVRLNRTPVTNSYPSGHTAATFALYGAIALLATRSPHRRAWRAPAFALVVLLDAFVGFARVYRGMHHVTDVLAGAALGAASLAVAVRVVAFASSGPTRAPDASDAPDASGAAGPGAVASGVAT